MTTSNNQPDVTFVDSPTVRQIKLAFEQTPARLRAAEQGWKAKRRADLAEAQQERKSRHIQDIPIFIPSPAKRYKAPPTPPMTPSSETLPLPKLVSTDVGDAPRRIRSYPLPPTDHTALGSTGSISIPNPSPNAATECTLKAGKQRIKVKLGGEAIDIECGGQSKTIRREDYRSWSRVEKRQWEIVLDLVEQVKRKTPRIFHPTALITITCSTPPDVVIAFTSPCHRAQTRQIPYVHEKRASPTTAVKFTYSPGREKVIIDTNSLNGSGPNSAFRTRRSIPISPFEMTNLHMDVTRAKLRDALGLCVGVDWLQAEVEAVGRFWELRHEWWRHFIRS